MLGPMRVALATLVAIAAVSISAAAAPAASRMALSCTIGGNTTVTGIAARTAHFRFVWFYANGSSYKSDPWVWYAASIDNGTAYIPTRGKPVRAEAIEHRAGAPLKYVRASCG
jgi:hypothetical protein